MKQKKRVDLQDREEKRALNFERALHRWNPWLNSIKDGRKVLKSSQGYPSVKQMRKIAGEVLLKLDFSPCIFFELYWLCCVFTDYETKHGFMFNKIILPREFPLPFGFRREKELNFRGIKIIPPFIWSEKERQFQFSNNPAYKSLPLECKKKAYQKYPDDDFILVVPDIHPVRKFVRRGRMVKTMPNGETLLE